MLFSDLNLSNVKSDLVDELIANDNNLHINIIYHNIDILTDFNKRNVTSLNINEMISFCDYLMLQDTMYFIVNNSVPTLEKYVLDEEHSKYHKLPRFMTTCNATDILRHNVPNMANLCNWLKFSITNRGMWKGLLCTLAGMNSHIDCLRYLHKKSECTWSLNTINETILKGNFICFKYLIDNDCDINAKTIQHLIDLNRFEALKYVLISKKYYNLNDEDITLYDKCRCIRAYIPYKKRIKWKEWVSHNKYLYSNNINWEKYEEQYFIEHGYEEQQYDEEYYW